MPVLELNAVIIEWLIFRTVVESCVNQNVPEPVCRGKFPFSSSCDLPSAQGNMVQTYLNEQKAECNTIYKYEAAPIQDSHSDK